MRNSENSGTHPASRTLGIRRRFLAAVGLRVASTDVEADEHLEGVLTSPPGTQLCEETRYFRLGLPEHQNQKDRKEEPRVSLVAKLWVGL